MRTDVLERSICEVFCKSISVNPTEAGLAISTFLEDTNKDPLGFYLIENENGLRLEDDGSYIASLIAMGFDLEKGPRHEFIKSVLSHNGAYVDSDTYEIKSDYFNEDALQKRVTEFMAALLRVRDVEYWTRERVENTFKTDVYNALVARMGDIANIDQNTPVNRDLKDFPCDIIVTSKNNPTKSAGIFVATGDDKLNEALLLKLEAKEKGWADIPVIAVIERINSVSQRKFQRAQNRDIVIPIYRDDERESVERIVRAFSAIQ